MKMRDEKEKTPNSQTVRGKSILAVPPCYTDVT